MMQVIPTPYGFPENRSLLLIDSGVADIDQLITGVRAGTSIYVLDGDQDGVEQITGVLSGMQNVESVQIVSHGKAGGIELGTNWLDAQTLPSYISQLKSWDNALGDDADILLYGCNVAQGEAGQAFVKLLAQTTGADVAASNNLTGSMNLGGDWDLEVHTGKIKAPIIWRDTELEQYNGILEIEVVKDINPGTASGGATYLTNVNGMLYFSADNGINGDELWKSDGTEAGTVLVKDINLGVDGSSLGGLVNVSGTLYFAANDGIHGDELWKSDGTEAGTVLVKDINPGMNNSSPGSGPFLRPVIIYSGLTNVNGTLYFAANDGIHGIELWKSDGTEAGTVLVKDINLGINNSGPGLLSNLNGILYFTANDGLNGTALWKSDGTEAGTILVKDPDSSRFDPAINEIGSDIAEQSAVIDGTLYFPVRDGAEYGLWKSDGTEAGTTLVKPRVGIRYMINIGKTLYFSGSDSINGEELWKSDGTEVGTVLVKDISPGRKSSDPFYFASVSSALYFTAGNDIDGYALWKSDGTEAGTVMVSRQDEVFSSFLTNFNNTLYFAGKDSISGNELRRLKNNNQIGIDDNYTTDESDSITVTANSGVLANDTNKTFLPLSATLITSTKNGSLLFNQDGSFTYTPNLKFTGLDSFIYKNVTPFGESSPTTVKIQVIPNSTIIATSSRSTLFGTARSDRFVFDNMSDAGNTVVNFTIGSDKLVLTDLMFSINYRGTNPFADGVISVRQIKPDLTALMIDPDGFAGRAFTLAPFVFLNNVLAADLLNNPNNFIL